MLGGDEVGCLLLGPTGPAPGPDVVVRRRGQRVLDPAGLGDAPTGPEGQLAPGELGVPADLTKTVGEGLAGSLGAG